MTKKYGNLVMCYVDDVVIATPTLEDHIERLDEVFACVKRSGLKCKPSKCEILKDSSILLGQNGGQARHQTGSRCSGSSSIWKLPKSARYSRIQVFYLGRMMDRHGIRPDPDAVEAVLTWKLPKMEHQLMNFLGFAKYYREFIKGYADNYTRCNN